MKTSVIRWLFGEIEKWKSEGVITEEEAASIRGRYPALPPERPWGTILFGSIGAVIIGLGIILVVAYNWEAMHRFVKLAIIFGMLLAAHGTGFYLRRKSDHFVFGEAFHVLGTMFFGAGIWLTAQIYHIQEHLPTAFLIWGVGALAMAWAVPSSVTPCGTEP